MKVATFVRKYNGKVLEDAGAYKSAEFVQFARDMKSTIREICKEVGAELVKFSVGHYDVSGFAVKDGKYVYFRYSEPRHLSIDLSRADPMNGILIRTAEHEKDYRGGMNNFCNIYTFGGILGHLVA